MRALTIKEPWASLIINGHKEYEFRSWKTHYRGKILIHTSKSINKKELERFSIYNLDYSFGEIIGEAEIVDCVKVDQEFKETLIRKNSLVYHKSKYQEEYAFKLTNIVKYKTRIPYQGKLGLWNYSK